MVGAEGKCRECDLPETKSCFGLRKESLRLRVCGRGILAVLW